MIGPELAPAGVEEQGVAGSRTQDPERRLDVVDGDRVAAAEPLDPARGGDVSEQATGDDLGTVSTPSRFIAAVPASSATVQPL